MKKIGIFIILLLFIFNVKAKNNDDYGEYRDIFVKLNAAYDVFIGSCSNEERYAIIKYADGDLSRLSGGYDTFKSLSTSDGKVINDFCANYAEDLYDAINIALEYSSKGMLYSLKLESEVMIKKNVFINGSKILVRDDLTIVDDCDLISRDFVNVLNEFIGYVQIGCTSLTVILCMVDLYKIFISKDVDSKKGFKSMVKRVVALVILLMAPLIINIIIDLINRYVDVDSLRCLES